MNTFNSFKLQPSKGADGQPLKTSSAAGGVLAILMMAGTFWYFWGGGLQMDTSKRMDDVYKQVSSDSVEQYQIAKRQGDPMQICVQAGMVSATFLQQKDEASYQQWKATEKEDCIAAGLKR